MNDPYMEALRQIFQGLADAPDTHEEALAMLAILPHRGSIETPRVRRYLCEVRDLIRDRFPHIQDADVTALYTRIEQELPTEGDEVQKWMRTK